MKILVIGGCGFIGSALIRRLAPESEIVCLDNYSTGKQTNEIKGVTYIRGATENLRRFIPASFKFDWIFHFGEYSRISTSFDDFEEIERSNISGTSKVLRYWKDMGAKLIYAGSSSVFNNESLCPYTLSKANNIKWIKAMGEWFELPYVIAYFYNVYGKGQLESGRMATVIGIFERYIREGLPLPVYFPGNQKRDFTHIDDVVDGLVLAADNGQGEYSLMSGKSYSIFDLVDATQCDFEMFPERPAERFDSIGDGDRARELGWQPKTDVLNYLKTVAIEVKGSLVS